MELLKLTDKVYVIKGRTTNHGLVVEDKECIVIDTGLDKTSGQKIYNLINNNGWQLMAIINTHGHADHFGGNKRLVEYTGVPVYTSAWEANFIRHPKLQPFSLFSGVNPPLIMQNKFYMAPESSAEDIFENKDFIKRWGIEVVHLPGHSLGLIGIKKHDVLFVGDAYLSPDVLDKHPIPFLMDVDDLIETLCNLQGYKDCTYQINSHQGIYSIEDAQKVIGKNIARIQEVYQVIEKSLEYFPKTSEELIKDILDYFSISNITFLVYQLIIVSINAYLASMLNNKKIEYFIQQNRLYWTIT